jgi:hypothetical protein
VARRRSNTSRTAIEPSLIAVAARVTDPLRTSPDGEDSRLAGFQEQRHPVRVVEPSLRDVAAGEQEPVGFFGELARSSGREPPSMMLGLVVQFRISL